MLFLKNDPLDRYFKSYEYKDKLDFKNIFTIGITGSCGKTSTTLYLYYFLKKYYSNVCYIGTHKILYNDLIIDTDNTTLEIDKLYYYFSKYNINPKILIMEVSSHGINFARINCFKFDIAALTNLGNDHLDFHINVLNYHAVKLSFISSLLFNIKTFVPICYKNKLKKRKNVKFYKTNFKIFKNFNKVSYDYNNLYLSYLILRTLNYKKKTILNELNNINLTNGRGEIINHNNRRIIIDYAHHIESFEAILNDNNHNKVVVFGCGGNRDSIKRSKMGLIANKYCKHIIITQDNSRNENIDNIISDITVNIKDYLIIKDRKQAIEYALETYKNLDIYILGKGDETFIEENGIKIPFNDKICVLNYLNINNIN